MGRKLFSDETAKRFEKGFNDSFGFSSWFKKKKKSEKDLEEEKKRKKAKKNALLIIISRHKRQ